MPTLALKLSHNNTDMIGKINVDVMMMVWQKQGINSVKNIPSRNFNSLGYFTTAHNPILLNRNLNQLKCVGGCKVVN